MIIFHLYNEPLTRGNNQSTPEVSKDHLHVITRDSQPFSSVALMQFIFDFHGDILIK